MLAEPANNNDATAVQGAAMRIFIFKSEARPELRAFSAELDGSRLPTVQTLARDRRRRPQSRPST
jgi:hypothetical protein